MSEAQESQTSVQWSDNARVASTCVSLASSVMFVHALLIFGIVLLEAITQIHLGAILVTTVIGFILLSGCLFAGICFLGTRAITSRSA